MQELQKCELNTEESYEIIAMSFERLLEALCSQPSSKSVRRNYSIILILLLATKKSKLYLLNL